MVVSDRSFPNGSPVCEYWLTRCEGFTVRAGSRNLGVVEQLGFGAPTGRVQTLVLRKRHRRRRALEAGQVLAVVPARQLLITRRVHHKRPSARPAARALGRGGRSAGRITARSAAVATPVVVALVRALAAVAGAFAHRAAVELRLATARVVREARDRHVQLGRPFDGEQADANEYSFALGHDRLQQCVGRGRKVGPTRIP